MTAPKGRWVAIEHCRKCDVVLTTHEAFYSSGTCPYCGHDSGFTIVDTVNKPVFIPYKPNIFEKFGSWLWQWLKKQ